MALQRNVQQQNALTKEDMLRWATLLEAEGSLPWLHVLLRQHGLESRQGTLVSLAEVPDQDGRLYSGVWIGPDHRFWEFEATVGTNSSSVELEKFVDITAEVIITKHGRGTGRSFGQLAVEVLEEHSRRFTSPVDARRNAGEA